MRVIRLRTGRTAVLAATCVALALAASACSSSGIIGSGSNGSRSAGDPATAACISKADAFLRKYDAPPTTLPYQPLTKTPSRGAVIKLVNGHIPADNDIYNGLASAAQAVGWTAKKIIHQGTVEDVASKFEQAVSEHPTAIAVDGWPVATLQKPLDDARKAGIIVLLGSVTDTPTSNPGLAAVPNGNVDNKLRGAINAYLFLRASKCTGHVGVFNLPFPILKVSTDSFIATVKQNCPQCKVGYSEIQTKDIGTPAAATAIVSKLQSDPSVKYVYSIIADLANGLPGALTQAGISGVQIFGQTPTTESIKALRDKQNAWWIGLSPQMTGWSAMYFILLARETGKVVPQTPAPQAVLTPENVGSSGQVPSYPTDYQDQFKKLWKIGA